MSGCMALIYLLVGRESSVFYRVVLAVSDLPCVTGPNQHIDLAATSEMASARLSCFQLAKTTEAEMHFQFRCYRTPKSRSRARSLSSCTASGPTVPASNGVPKRRSLNGIDGSGLR